MRDLGPVLLSCPVCKQEGPDRSWLGEHLRQAHRLDAPQLLLAGEPAGRETAHREPIDSRLVSAVNATRIRVGVDGAAMRVVDDRALASVLAGLRDGVAEVELANERADGATAPRDFRVRVAVAELEHLDWVEERFADIVSADPQIREADEFAAAVSAADTAGPYASALHGYLIALLQKDERIRGAGFEFEKHRSRMSAALEELRHYRRPLARAVAGVIRFNLNLFVPPFWVAGIRELDICAIRLRSLASGREVNESPTGNEEPVGECPVDQMTHTLLQLNGDLERDDRRRSATTSLLRLAGAPRTTPADAAKARALGLWDAGTALSEDQRRAAQALVNDHLFGSFAGRLLTR